MKLAWQLGHLIMTDTRYAHHTIAILWKQCRTVPLHFKDMTANPSNEDRSELDVLSQTTCDTEAYKWDRIDHLNILRPRQNECHFADNIFKCIFLNENVQILIKISPKFVPKGPINNIPTLVQIMAWRRPGDKPLSEPMMVSLLKHICVTRPEWVKGRKKYKTCITWLNHDQLETHGWELNTVATMCYSTWPSVPTVLTKHILYGIHFM